MDWYEAYVDICGEREMAYVFCMRSMASGGAFHLPSHTPANKRFWKRMNKGFSFRWSICSRGTTT